MNWIFPYQQWAAHFRAPFTAIFATASAHARTDFGTTWYDPGFSCSQTGMSAIPASAVPGCMVPGLLSVAFVAGA